MGHEGPTGGPVNLGNPVELTIDELVTLVIERTGTSSDVVTRPLPVDDPRRRRPDITRAKQLLGWAPRTPLEVGLEKTIAWFAREIGSAKDNASRPAQTGTRAAAI
jgi:UDP-glucuronate decarboxylase